MCNNEYEMKLNMIKKNESLLDFNEYFILNLTTLSNMSMAIFNYISHTIKE